MTWRKRVPLPSVDIGLWNRAEARKLAPVEIYRGRHPRRLGRLTQGVFGSKREGELVHRGYLPAGSRWFQWGYGDLFKTGMHLTLMEAS